MRSHGARARVQARRQLPVTLVLGLATSAVSLQQMLPSAAADCLQTRHFQLVQVRSLPRVRAPPPPFQLAQVQALPAFTIRRGTAAALFA